MDGAGLSAFLRFLGCPHSPHWVSKQWKASTTRFLDFGSGFKESELHSGRNGFEIPIEILLKSQSLEVNVLQRPLLSSGKNVDDVLGTFGDLGMAWVAKKWPEKATRDPKRQKREANSIQCSQAV